jgi:hypothetical protein
MKRASKTLLLVAAAAALGVVFVPAPFVPDSARARPAATSAKKADKAKEPPPANPASRSAADPRRARNFDFLGDNVEGTGILPSGESVHVPGPAEHGSLIRLRTHFVREIAASTDRL